MGILLDGKEIQRYMFMHREDYDPVFVLAHAPYCAYIITSEDHEKDEKKVFQDALMSMVKISPYAVPFWFTCMIHNKSLKASAGECKKMLKEICWDLDELEPYYEKNARDQIEISFSKMMRDNLVTLMKNFIAGIRDEQLKTGASESAMANYAPIVPYTVTMKRADEESGFDKIDSTEIFHQSTNMINQYKDICSNHEKAVSVLSYIALQCPMAIIDNAMYLKYWKCTSDVFDTFHRHKDAKFDINLKSITYLAWCFLLLSGEPCDKIEDRYNLFMKIVSHNQTPIPPDEFQHIFESMFYCSEGNIEDMMTTEAWTALSEDSQAYVDKLLENVPKDKQNDIYDLDALLAQFYTMRHIETNDYTNQFFLAEYQNLTINSYSYINETIMTCEINDTYLGIPYTDIAADYKVRVITIDKNHKIKVWDNPADIGTDPVE